MSATQSAAILNAPRRFSQKAFRIILASSPQRAIQMAVEDHIRRVGRITPSYILEGIMDRHADLFVEALVWVSAVHHQATGKHLPTWVFPRHFLDQHPEGTKYPSSPLFLLTKYLASLGWDGRKRPKGALPIGRFKDGLLAVLQNQESARLYAGFKEATSVEAALKAGRINQDQHDRILRIEHRMSNEMRSPLVRACDMADDAYWEVMDGYRPFDLVVAGNTKGHRDKVTGEPVVPGIYFVDHKATEAAYLKFPRVSNAWLLVVPKMWGVWALKRPGGRMEVPDVRAKNCVWVLVEPRPVPEGINAQECWTAVRVNHDHGRDYHLNPDCFGLVAIKDGKARSLEILKDRDAVWVEGGTK